jgi:hypothetical protein
MVSLAWLQFCNLVQGDYPHEERRPTVSPAVALEVLKDAECVCRHLGGALADLIAEGERRERDRLAEHFAHCSDPKCPEDICRREWRPAEFHTERQDTHDATD